MGREKSDHVDDDFERELQLVIAAVRSRSQLHPHLELEAEKQLWIGGGLKQRHRGLLG